MVMVVAAATQVSNARTSRVSSTITALIVISIHALLLLFVYSAYNSNYNASVVENTSEPCPIEYTETPNSTSASIEEPMSTNGTETSYGLIHFQKDNLDLALLKNTSKVDRYFSCDFYGLGHRDCRFSSPFVNVVGKPPLVLLFQAWTRFVEKYQIQYWLVHGTLLGWHWGNTIMDFDEDIDLAVTLDTMHRVMLPLNGTIFEGQYMLDINPTYARRTYDLSNVIDAIFLDIFSGAKIDLTAFSTRVAPCYTDQDEFVGASDKHKYRIDDIFPLNVSTMEGVKAYIPRNAKKLLIDEYTEAALEKKDFKGYHFNGVHWVNTKPETPVCKVLNETDLYVNATRFFIPWEMRDRLRQQTTADDAELNSKIRDQLNRLDIDNTISKGHALKSGDIFTVAEFNIQRGSHWCEAVQLIRQGQTTRHADIIFINEADWGMSRSQNGHIARLMAKELGMNYAWGIEFLELTPGNEEETKEARTAADCRWKGGNFQGKENALGYTGNAILSKWPLKDVSLVRFPGTGRLFHTGKKSWITAFGYEKRLGGRMALYASVDIPGYDTVHIGCFHLQATWDKGEAWQSVGKRTAAMIREHQDERDPAREKLFVIGGDGWGTNWCKNDVGLTQLNPFANGDWICGRNYNEKRDYEVVKATDVSDHNLLGLRLQLN